MTPADHANTVREWLRFGQARTITGTDEFAGFQLAVAALDALQTKAERQALNIDDLLRQLDEAVRQRDHAQDALRVAYDAVDELCARPGTCLLLRDRAALGDKP